MSSSRVGVTRSGESSNEGSRANMAVISTVLQYRGLGNNQATNVSSKRRLSVNCQPQQSMFMRAKYERKLMPLPALVNVG